MRGSRSTVDTAGDWSTRRSTWSPERRLAEPAQSLVVQSLGVRAVPRSEAEGASMPGSTRVGCRRGGGVPGAVGESADGEAPCFQRLCRPHNGASAWRPVVSVPLLWFELRVRQDFVR